MGIIARQSTKRTLVSFLGVLIGAVSTVFIYPNDREIYGLALFLFGSANLLLIFLNLGSNGLVVKYYPVFEKRKIKGFLTLLILVAIAAILVSGALLILIKPLIFKVVSFLNMDVDLLREKGLAIFLLSVLLIFIQMLVNQASNLHRIVVPSILNDFSYKIALPIFVLLVYFRWMNQDAFINAYLLFFLFVLIGMIYYVYSIGGLSIKGLKQKAIDAKLRAEMLVYMLYSGLNQIGGNIVARIDAIMVATMLSLEQTGTYGILLFMANTIEVPAKSIFQIGGPVISNSITHGDLANVRRVYVKSSINSLLIGILLFVGIWTVLNNVFSLMPNNADFYLYKNVFLFLSLSKLIDMTFSLNTHIIVYSRYYRYNLIFVLLLGLANLVFNFYFIRMYGLTGAALATAISMALYNLVKLVFIKIKFDLWPFSYDTLKLFILAIICFVIGTFLPDPFGFWPDIIIKSCILFFTYYFLLKVFRIKAEIIDVFENRVQIIFELLFKRN